MGECATLSIKGRSAVKVLAQNADRALAEGDRERCTALIARLYGLFDGQFGTPAQDRRQA